MQIKVSKMFNLRLLSREFPSLGHATWKVDGFCSPGVMCNQYQNTIIKILDLVLNLTSSSKNQNRHDRLKKPNWVHLNKWISTKKSYFCLFTYLPPFSLVCTGFTELQPFALLSTMCHGIADSLTQIWGSFHNFFVTCIQASKHIPHLILNFHFSLLPKDSWWIIHFFVKHFATISCCFNEDHDPTLYLLNMTFHDALCWEQKSWETLNIGEKSKVVNCIRFIYYVKSKSLNGYSMKA